MLSPVSSLVLFKKSFYSFCRFLLPNQFHLKPAPSQPPLSPLLPLSVPSFALCGSQLREVFNPAFERSAGEKRGRGTAILSLFSRLCSSSAALTHPLQSCSFLLFSSPFFFPSSVWVPFFFLFLACGIALALPGTGRRVKYPSPVNFRGENSPSASPVFIALCLRPILDFSSPFTPQSVCFKSRSVPLLPECVCVKCKAQRGFYKP